MRAVDAAPSNLDRTYRALALLVLASGLAAAVYGLARPLWLDDTHSTYHAFAGPGQVIDHLRTDSHPPLYFWILSLWMKLGGMSEVWLRALSTGFTVAAGLFLYRHGRESGDPRLPWLYVTFFLLNPVVSGHMHTVRPYALLGLASAASTVAYLRLAASQEGEARRRDWVTFVLAAAAGTFTHYWSFFVLAGQGVGAMLFGRGRMRWMLPVACAVAALPFALFWSPVFVEQMEGNPTGWMQTPGGFFLAGIPVRLLGAGGMYGTGLEKLAWGFLGLAGLAILTRSTPRLRLAPLRELGPMFRSRELALAATIPAVVGLLALGLSQIRPVFDVRYTIAAIPALAILMGDVIARFADRRMVPLLVIAFVGYAAAGRKKWIELDGQLDNRQVAEYLVANHRPGDEILSVTLGYAPTLHYLRALAPEDELGVRAFPVEIEHHPGWRDREALTRDLDALRREAAELVDSLRSRPRPGRVWFLPDLGRDQDVSAILDEALDRSFELRSVAPVAGWWVGEVRLYDRRQDSTSPAPPSGAEGDR